MEKNLPAIIDLYEEKQIELTDKRNQLNVLMNQPPNPIWIKTHPSIPNYRYLPIERIEYLLTRIFVKWRVEVKNVSLIANSVCVSIRLHYLDPITGEWDWQDGVGASPLQTDKGAGAIDFNKMKNGAVMMAAPAAESYAIKDAADKLGKLFGKDLNRKDQIGYDNLMGNFDEKTTTVELKNQLESLLNNCDPGDLRDGIVSEVLEAKRNKADSPDFYQRMIDKLN